ncbi:2-hydroxyacid dehydrogenase [Leptothrix discophora]|uniref:Glyoxylate/hydroxypyruvate reductase A n=1 Tax=Leptothrix discophora TaxID=89 RepID=A0ABT9G657_LEPDI|nr:glyoxylate/hydroxypyruvate reductase A [Leptothrix discophora]MDP4301742.1 glyoxylate/hydroxypyruvate reductase A [Leptothrix discophora]
MTEPLTEPTLLLTGRWDRGERDDWHRALAERLPEARWVLDAPATPEEAGRIDVAIVANPAPAVLRGLPRLRLVQSLWAGVEKLLADDSVPAGLPIARMVDPAMNAAMAETALWAVLMLHRGFHRYAQAQREGLWAPHPQRRADEVRVAVLGLGQMGRTAALRLRAQGYDVTGWGATPRLADPDGLACTSGPQALGPLLARSEIVVNLLPLTPATRGLIDARFLAALPRGAAVVNLARGAHLVEADLLAALASGQLGHAVLDVFATEPLPAGHAFWSHPGVTLLPHAAAMTDLRSAADVAVANVRAALAGQPVRHRVDRARGY